MALNEQILREQTDLGLTDAQITAIAALSQKDEDTVFPQKFGEMLGNMDTMIAAKSSIVRNEGEKTSDYMGRVLVQLKSAADEGATFKTTNESLTAEIAKLKDDIAKGTGNEQLKADLEKLRGDLASAKKVNGELQLRGFYSVNAEPKTLLLVDGSQVLDFSHVNIHEVESVTVYKDGASVFGLRGFAGAIDVKLRSL